MIIISFTCLFVLSYDNITMLQAWARLCKCLGQDFLPYMSVVMPPLLQSAQLKPDVTITSADSDNDIEDSDDERLYLLLFLLIIMPIRNINVDTCMCILFILSSHLDRSKTLSSLFYVSMLCRNTDTLRNTLM